jgi:hypothetical protein
MLTVYLCAFINKAYIEEAKVCIASLRTNGRFFGPIYLFTNLDTTIESVNVIKVDCDSVPQSAGFKTRIFNYLPIDSSSIFLYLDTDIVVLKPLPSFDEVGSKVHLYGYPSKTQNHYHYCGFLTNDPNYTKEVAINTGILLYRPSLKIKEIFDEADALYTSLVKSNKVNCVWEQPSLSLVLIKHNMHDVTLTELVYEERWGSGITSNHLFNHFCGERDATRSTKMKKYLQ